MPQIHLAPDVRASIEDVITRFFWSLDNDAIDDVVSLFTDDAIVDMGVPGRPIASGQDSVRALFGVRPEGRVVRHHWGGLLPLSDDGDIAVSFQFTTYVGRKGEPAPPTATSIGDVAARFRADAEGHWRFAGMDRSVIFTF